MKKLLRLLTIGLAASSLSLTGCGLDQHPPYSANVKFGVRTDPVIRGPSTALGEERFDPDRPGVFPLLKVDEVYQADHPYYVKLKATVLQATLNKIVEETDANPSEERRKDLQDKAMQDPKQRPKLNAALDAVLRSPAALSDKDRKELADALEAVFGTPANPVIQAKWDDNGEEKTIQQDTLAKLKLDKIEMGGRHYRIHCMHCHGVTGDGRGPTSRWINPHPRDFRAGKFKFTSVHQVGLARAPSRADLLRTLRSGLEGTAMPTFNLLADDELEAIVSYVIYLSIRGTSETNVLNRFDFNAKEGKLEWNAEEEGSITQAVHKNGVDLAQDRTSREGGKKVNISWAASQDPANWIKVEPYPFKANDVEALTASVKRGQMMFTAKPSPEYVKEYSTRLPAEVAAEVKAKLAPGENLETKLQEKALNTLKTPNCVSCHTDYGRQAKFRFDDWGTLVRPNNFSQGVFRGGKRPVDMYYRIHSGISPSGMTNFGGTLQGQDIWDLVNFVSTLSFPGMRDRLGVAID